jgi:hypothetical protein
MIIIYCPWFEKNQHLESANTTHHLLISLFITFFLFSTARHEVKNGILAAIGLLDHVREGIAREKSLFEEWKAFSGMQQDSRGRVGGGGCLPGKQQDVKQRSFFDRSTRGGKATNDGTPPEYDTTAAVAGKKEIWIDLITYSATIVSAFFD